jgi:hypothetical protein
MMYDAWLDCYPAAAARNNHCDDMVTNLELLPSYMYDGDITVYEPSSLPFKKVVEVSGEVIYDGRSPKLTQRIF